MMKVIVQLLKSSYTRNHGSMFNLCMRAQKYNYISVPLLNKRTIFTNFSLQNQHILETPEISQNVLSEEDEKRLKVMKLEYQVFQSTGVKVPDVMEEKDWMHMLQHCKAIHARKKYYIFLFKNEKSAINYRMKKDINIRLHEEKRADITRQVEEGSLESFKNTFMMFVQDRTMNRFYNNNLFRAMTYGPHLIFDFSFEDQMKFREYKNLFKQMLISYGANKTHPDPFHFHFCNLSSSSSSYKEFTKFSSNLETLPITISPDCYLNHYPKEKLIYLSPNATEVMESYDEDATYIVGGLVDKSAELPLTMAKAKREGIRMVKFPIDHYVKWTQGSKSLTLNQVVEILLDIRKNSKWLETLEKHLPKRKFITIDDEVKEIEEERKRKTNLKRWSVSAGSNSYYKKGADYRGGLGRNDYYRNK